MPPSKQDNDLAIAWSAARKHAFKHKPRFIAFTTAHEYGERSFMPIPVNNNLVELLKKGESQYAGYVKINLHLVKKQVYVYPDGRPSISGDLLVFIFHYDEPRKR